MKFLSPVDGLIVNKAADAVLTIKNDSSNNSHHAKLQLYSLRPDGTNYSSSSLYLDNYSTYLSADEALYLQTNGATRLFIHGSGNVGIGTANPSEKLDVVGSIELTQHLKATGTNLSFSAGGNQILNVDLNGKVYPSSHNAKDLGFNRGLAFRDVYATGFRVGTASTISEHNTTGALRITTQHGYTSIGAENSSWSHFNTDRAAFYFNKRIEIAGELAPYHANSHNLGTSTKPWVRIYGTTIYQGADRVLATRPDVHTALYSTGGNADDYTQFGIYRNYNEGGPIGGHNTILHVSQTNGTYGFQIGANTTSDVDGLFYRSKSTTFGSGTWHQIASRSWVNSQGYASASGNATQAWVNAQAFASASGNATQDWVQAQGYITSETDSQTLSWGSGNGQLTISNGNTVDLDGRYMYGAVGNGGDFNDLTGGKNSNFVAFNASNIADAPDTSWYNGLVTTHSNYLSSYIVNKHRTNDWYLSWRDTNVTPSANWSRVWHSNDFTATNVSNWNTAYGWGNHASAGYLTAVPSGYATEAYVGTQISNLVSSAPSTLDTLNELAAALGDDPNFATTVTNSIATKLPFETYASGTDLNTISRTTFGAISTGNTSVNRNQNYSAVYSLGVAGIPNTLQLGTASDYNASGLWVRQFNQNASSPQGVGWQDWAKVWTDNDFANNSSNWNTAYSWGNHASAGYLTSLPSHNHDDRYYTETEINNKFNLYTRYQTGSNFVDGTLVRTSIVANVTNGDSYLLEITGKSYNSGNYPFKVMLQGYIYNDTFISNSALSYGGDFAPTIKVFEDGGYLCFWWDRISYWNSFSVNVIDASHHDQAAENQVLAIEDAADATYSKQVVVSVRKSLNQSFDGNWTIGNSTWINHDNDTTFNSYNENIRLRNAANGASVIAFGAEGGAGTPEGSILNYSNRFEVRRGGPWKMRIYDTVVNFSGNVEAVGTISATGGNSTNWNTAYGWGNHASAGYITSFDITTQTDSKYVRSDVYDSTYNGLQVHRDIGNIDGSWTDDDHTLGLETQGTGNIVINFHRAGNSSHNLRYNGSQFRFDNDLESTGVITSSGGNSSNWNTAYGWGNHASAGYLTSVPNHSAALITSGTLDAARLPWQSGNDGFTGTYPLVWKAGDNPWTASWLTVNGTLDQLNSKAFGSYVGDTGVILQSYNASASNAEQFRIRHNYGSVDIANPRGNIYFETPTYFETTTVAQATLYVGDSIQHWGDGGTGMYFEQNDFISVRTAAANRLIVGTDGKVYFGSNTNKGYLREFASNTYGSQIGKIARITFTGGFSDWDGDNHAIVSKDINGSMADSLSVNSYNDVTIRLDSNNNNATSHFYITNDTLGSAMNNRLLDINTGTNETEIATAFVPYTDRAQTLGRDDRRWQIVFCETLDSAGQHESNLQNPKGEKSVGEYATGTVLVWKGGKNIPCTEAADHMRMGIAVNGVESPLVQGAEPVLVSGPVSEGDYLVTSSIEGHAKAISPQFMRQHGLYDCVIGKALESGEGESYLIKTWINI